MARRKLASLNAGRLTTRIYHDSTWAEYVVCFDLDGKHQVDADYSASDKQDAFDTANAALQKAKAQQ